MLHTPYNKVKGLLREKGYSYAFVAKILKKSVPTVCRKINGDADFLVQEALVLCKLLNAEMDIFLN